MTTGKSKATDGAHTPGPWMAQGICYEGEERGACFIVAENLGGLVGAALPWLTELDEGDFPRVEANARLMAAAPEMLAALEELVERASAFNVSGVYFDEPCMTAEVEALEKARAAISKAQGTTP